MPISAGVGWLGVLLAVVFWGTWASTLKAKSVVESRVDSMVLQGYISTSVLLVSVFLTLFVPFRWTWWAAVGALIWVPTNAVFVVCIRILGLGIVSGISAGTIIASAFLWGATATSLWGEPPCVMSQPGMAALGLLILIASVVGLALFGSPETEPPPTNLSESTPATGTATADSSSPSLKGKSLDSESDTSAIASEPSSIDTDTIFPEPANAVSVTVATPPKQPLSAVAAVASPEDGTHIQRFHSSIKRVLSKPKHLSKRTFVIALASCVAAGFVSGSCVVPLKLAQRQGVQGLEYVPPFGIAVFVMTMAMVCGEMAIRGHIEPLHARQVALPGMAGGILWSIGNIGSVYAALSPLGQTTGFPLTQSCVLVAGAMAIVVFKEVKGMHRILPFFASGATLIIGAAVLANFGQCKS